MKNEYSSPNTLAHELVAREEKSVEIFFAAFAIQYYMHKDMLVNPLNPPAFIKFFGDIEIYASQRVFINNIINNKKYKPVLAKIEKLLLEYNINSTRLPYQSYLNSINKAFLIRQIFEHTDQTLSKYGFIKDFLNKDLIDIDLDLLDEKTINFPVEQKILILVRIFVQLKDNFENKKKEIMESFLENIKRKKEEYVAKNRVNTVEYSNVISFLEKFAQ